VTDDPLRDDEPGEARMMLAAVAIARIACELPVDLAVPVLMMVVTEIIAESSNAMAHWDTLANGIEAHRRIQTRYVRGSSRSLQ
jgi:hypothetical protein